MTRQELNLKLKYPETDFFHFYNANPKGRITGDCRIRALAAASDIDYNEIVMMFAVIQIETGYDQTMNQGISILLDKLGWQKHKQPKKANGKKYTAREFCKLQQNWAGSKQADGVVIADRIFATCGSHHVVAIVDGKVFDTWDSTDGCIGNYWTKK